MRQFFLDSLAFYVMDELFKQTLPSLIHIFELFQKSATMALQNLSIF